jgi:hypothetical protein
VEQAGLRPLGVDAGDLLGIPDDEQDREVVGARAAASMICWPVVVLPLIEL